MPTNTTSTTSTFTTTRRFGVEIEFCTDRGMENIAELLSNAGINTRAESYNHTTRSCWKLVTDASVVHGFELVSPPLAGVDGIEEVKRACAVLVEAGCTISLSCGLHIHVDAAGLSGASVVNVLRRAVNHEAAIDAIVPQHRRNNDFALSVVRDFNLVESYLQNNPNATAEAVCSRIGDRYRKVNLCSYMRHGTIEFRQHSGSIDGTKVANWIMFCVTFVEDSIVVVRTVTPAAPVQTAPVTPTPSGATLGDLIAQRLATSVPVSPFPQSFPRERVNARSRAYRRLLNLFIAEGAYRSISASTIAATLEIAEASVPSYISNFRSIYPSVVVEARRGRGYYTTSSDRTLHAALNPAAPVQTPAPAAPAPRPAAPVTVIDIPNDLGLFANLPVAVRAYYQERAMDFSTR